MNPRPDPSDESLRALLREMAHEREKLAPSYQRLAQRARHAIATPGRPRWSLPRFAALATAVVLVTTATLWWSRPAPDAPAWDAQLAAFEEELEMLPLPATAPEPEALKLPTDFLLAASDD